MTEPTVVLLAGASGSGKSRIARLAGCPQLALDDFYHDHDHPGLPRTFGSEQSDGIVDWDEPATWDAAGAMTAIIELCQTGSTDIPIYDISASRRVGSHRLGLGTSRTFVAEGLFAPELVVRCQQAGVPFEAVFIDRPRTQTMIFRFVRDVRERRKPLLVLIRRGLALWRTEPVVRSHALAQGCRPVSFAEALDLARGKAAGGKTVDGKSMGSGSRRSKPGR